MKLSTWQKWLIVIGAGVVIAVVPRPESVTQKPGRLLLIFVATIVGSIVQPISGSAVVLLGVIATALFGALPIEKALTGYADK
jgi:di/tricarboxylate transporter